MTNEPEPLRDLTLPNGLRLVVEPMSWLPTATAVLQLPLGVIGDPEDAQGASVALHEWLQRGAGGRDARGQADAWDRYGVRRGGGCGREVATLSAAFLAQDVVPVLGLLADAVRAPALADAEFDGARALALQELAGLDDAPAQRLGEAVVRARYQGPHGRSAYGERAHLEALTAAALRAEARARLGPEGAVLAIAGGGDPEAIVASCVAAFGAWQGGHRAVPQPVVRPPHRQHVAGAGTQTQIGLVDDAVAPGAAGWIEQALAMAALSGAMGSRLGTEVRERRGLVYTVASSVRTVRGDAYRFTYASTTAERAAETLEVVTSELGRWRAGLEATELERARTMLRANLVLQSESTGGRASRLVGDVHAFGRPRPLAEVEARLLAADLDTVNAFLASRPALSATVVTSGPVPRGWAVAA